MVVRNEEEPLFLLFLSPDIFIPTQSRKKRRKNLYNLAYGNISIGAFIMIAVCCSQSHSKSHALTKGGGGGGGDFLFPKLPPPLHAISQLFSEEIRNYSSSSSCSGVRKNLQASSPLCFPTFIPSIFQGKQSLIDTLQTAKSMSDVTRSLFGQGKNWRLNRTHLFFSLPFLCKVNQRGIAAIV